MVEYPDDIAADNPQLYDDIKNSPDIAQVRAFYDPNTRVAYIIRQHLHDEVDVFVGLHHEIRGHFAMQQSFGSAIDPFLDAVYKAYQKEIKASAIPKSYRDPAASAAENNRTYAEEYLSEMVQTGKDPYRMIDRFVRFIKKLLGKLGIKGKFTKADARYMLSKAATEHVKGRTREYAPGRRRMAKFSKTPVFYSQLESMMLTQAPPKGTPEAYLKWLEKAKKGGEKLEVDVEPLVEKIIKMHKFDEVITKKHVTEMMQAEAGIPKKFLNTFWQQTAPKSGHAQEYIEFLRNAERAATGGPIKQEEVDITGLEAYLKSLTQAVANAEGDAATKTELTRGDIGLFINANKMLLSDEYAGTFNENYLELVEDVYGPQEDPEFVGPPAPKRESTRAMAKRPVEATDLHFEYSESADPDEGDWDYYYNDYLEENLSDEQDTAAENVDQSDYLDNEAFEGAVTERAQEMADAFNGDNAAEIEEGDEEERDADDYDSDARNEIDADDFLDEDAYNEAVDDARETAEAETRESAEEHADEQARENADEIWVDDASGWRLEGHENRENWRIYDNDMDEVVSDFTSTEDAIESAVEEMNDRDWYFENGEILDSDGDALFDAHTPPSSVRSRRRVREPGHVATKWGTYTVGSNENYRELKLLVPARFTPDGQYEYSTHFPTKNYLVYARLSDKRIVSFDKDGERIIKKVLFVEELQADWPGNQAGMVGFRSDNVKVYDETTEERDELLTMSNLKAERFIKEITEAQIEGN